VALEVPTSEYRPDPALYADLTWPPGGEVTEGECEQEDLVPGKDEHGNDIFVSNAQGAYGTVHTAK
jgi:hypothetical protein